MTIELARINELTIKASLTVDMKTPLTEYSLLKALVEHTHKQTNGKYKSEHLNIFFANQKKALNCESFDNFRAFVLLKTMEEYLTSKKSHKLPLTLQTELNNNIDRLILWCEKPTIWNDYIDDVYWKDLAIAGGALIPLRGGVLHLSAGLGFRQALSNDLSSSFQYLIFLLRNGRNKYFEIHTHLPLISDFNEENWAMNYQDILKLLELDKDARGVFRASWFLDPQLANISPKINYLAKFPLLGGANLFKVGTDHSNSAFSRSANRKNLFESGQYTPTTYLLIWPKQRMLSYFKDFAVKYTYCK